MKDYQREWTEEDEDQLRTDRRNYKQHIIDKVRADAQKRYDTQYENYQSSGAPSAERAMRKWQDLLDICAMAEESLSQSCQRCEMRYKQGRGLEKQLKQRQQLGEEQISMNEAINLISAVTSY